MQVDIWKMGNFYKVYSDNTSFVRQLANAEDCKIMCSYFEKARLAALDAILPFKAKNGRRIVRLLKNNGFRYRESKPNLAKDKILSLERVDIASNA